MLWWWWGRGRYLSRRFERYPGTQLMLRLFERHSREKVRVFAYAFGAGDGSDERATVQADADVFRDVSMLTARAAAQTIHQDGVQVLIDYDGVHDFNSVALLAHRPAPVQVTWLGFAGSAGLGPRVGRDEHGRGVAGAAVVDFVIGDRIVTPATAASGHAESLAFLPRGLPYQPQDEQQGGVLRSALRPTFPDPLHRPALSARGEMLADREEQQPEAGSQVVLACLSRSHKIDPAAFADWLQILTRVPSAVLWIMAEDAQTQQRLSAEASARGVHSDRLVWLPRVSREHYFERLWRVDLFLDTRPYGAHTTAADALWVATPVLTLPADATASKVGRSLLQATNSASQQPLSRQRPKDGTALPPFAQDRPAGHVERLSDVLVASDRKDFVDTAVRLASGGPSHDPGSSLGRLRERIGATRGDVLFNSTRFTRGLERTVSAMWELRCATAADATLPHLFAR